MLGVAETVGPTHPGAQGRHSYPSSPGPSPPGSLFSCWPVRAFRAGQVDMLGPTLPGITLLSPRPQVTMGQNSSSQVPATNSIRNINKM